MNFQEFIASRRFMSDMREHPSAGGIVMDFEENCHSGYIYSGDLIIESDANGENCCCTIGNESQTGSLAELEAWLFLYGVDEQLFELSESTSTFLVGGSECSLNDLLSANRDDNWVREWALRANVGDQFPAVVDCRRIR